MMSALLRNTEVGRAPTHRRRRAVVIDLLDQRAYYKAMMKPILDIYGVLMKPVISRP